jgi:hypothetical protein
MFDPKGNEDRQAGLLCLSAPSPVTVTGASRIVQSCVEMADRTSYNPYDARLGRYGFNVWEPVELCSDERDGLARHRGCYTSIEPLVANFCLWKTG